MSFVQCSGYNKPRSHRAATNGPARAISVFILVFRTPSGRDCRVCFRTRQFAGLSWYQRPDVDKNDTSFDKIDMQRTTVDKSYTSLPDDPPKHI